MFCARNVGKGEHSFAAVAEAVANLLWAKKKLGGTLKIGLEMVLSKTSIYDLPALVAWAADNEVDYILMTHLILYDKATESANLFNPNTPEAVRLFNKYNQIATARGIDLAGSIGTYRKSAGTQTDGEILPLFVDMRQEAQKNDIRLNLDTLAADNEKLTKEIQPYLNKAQHLAKSRGIELFLPPLQADSQRHLLPPTVM